MFVFDLTKNDVLGLADYQYIMSRIMEAHKVDYPCSRLSGLGADMRSWPVDGKASLNGVTTCKSIYSSLAH